MIRNKKGLNSFAVVLGIIVILFLVPFVIYLLGGDPVGTAFGSTVDLVDRYVIQGIFAPILGLGDNVVQFGDLMVVLAFILVLIVVAGTLDSIALFGDSIGGKFANFTIGVIIALIGVRAMPDGLWEHLAAPTSALAGALIAGIPFAAMIFITSKSKSRIFNKLLWLIYVLLFAYIVITRTLGGDRWTTGLVTYSIFAVLGLFMLIFDAQVRAWFWKERVATGVSNAKGKAALIQVQNLKKKLEGYQSVLADDSSTEAEIKKARDNIKDAEERIRELSGLS